MATRNVPQWNLNRTIGADNVAGRKGERPVRRDEPAALHGRNTGSAHAVSEQADRGVSDEVTICESAESSTSKSPDIEVVTG